MVGLKEKVKKELGYMKVGAKVLPKAVGKKLTGYVRGQYQAAKEEVALRKQARQEANVEAAKAYREEFIRLEKEKAIKKAKARAAGGGGFSGILAELGKAGERLSVSDMLGMPEQKQGSAAMGGVGDYIMPMQSRGQGSQGSRRDIDTGGYIMSGLPKRQVQTRRHGRHKNRGRR